MGGEGEEGWHLMSDAGCPSFGVMIEWADVLSDFRLWLLLAAASHEGREAHPFRVVMEWGRLVPIGWCGSASDLVCCSFLFRHRSGPRGAAPSV